ncbi:TIGR04222 domain-containing membrane protein [Streptomyces sp. NRRL S-1824]|uniref:TIGR04222 domain-containing membrane protein n=1 Tax=Streptomyces sp. NRRL S-1824 TaxID=1463889 RepID=UPI000A59C858|nr:TIGR04222 domain-containing membrane protein [Streptomyces sp. NRRL S-1824]
MNVVALLVTLGVVTSSTLLIVGLSKARGGPGGPVHDLYEVAFLNGGPGRVVDTALTAFQADGRLVVGGPGIVAITQPVAHDPVERAVLQAHAAAPSGALHTLRDAAMRHPAVQEVGDGLAARGLLAAPEATRKWRRWGLFQGFGCLLAIPVSFAVTVAQVVTQNDPTGFTVPFIVKVLPALFVGIPIGLVCAGIARARITGAGRQAARQYRAAHVGTAEPAHLVATLGLRALPDPVLRTQLVTAARMRTAAGRRPMSPSHPSSSSTGSGDYLMATAWCAGSGPADSGCGSSSGTPGGGGSGCGGGGGGCSSGSSCGSGSNCSSGSSCSSSSCSSSSCSSSSGSSCSSSSS